MRLTYKLLICVLVVAVMFWAYLLITDKYVVVDTKHAIHLKDSKSLAGEKIDLKISSDATKLKDPYEHAKCAVCGKEIWSDELHESTMAISIVVYEPTMTDKVLAKKTAEFYQKQLGPYKLGKRYLICWECWLRSMGVKP